jgi:hypothetical protein
MISSPMNLAMFGVFVLCLNILLVSMIRRRRTAAGVSQSRHGSNRYR